MTLQALLGIDLPIIQAPMAGVQGSALAVAVSNAGGLGSLPCALLSPDSLRRELAAIRSQTAKPEKTFPKHTAQVPPFPNELSTMRLNGGENDSVKKEVGPRPKSGKNIGMNEHKGKTGNNLRK